jgi:hypothetical protein
VCCGDIDEHLAWDSSDPIANKLEGFCSFGGLLGNWGLLMLEAILKVGDLFGVAGILKLEGLHTDPNSSSPR